MGKAEHQITQPPAVIRISCTRTPAFLLNIASQLCNLCIVNHIVLYLIIIIMILFIALECQNIRLRSQRIRLKQLVESGSAEINFPAG